MTRSTSRNASKTAWGSRSQASGIWVSAISPMRIVKRRRGAPHHGLYHAGVAGSIEARRLRANAPLCEDGGNNGLMGQLLSGGRQYEIQACGNRGGVGGGDVRHWMRPSAGRQTGRKYGQALT